MNRRSVMLMFAVVLVASFPEAADSSTQEQHALIQAEHDGVKAFMAGDAKAVADWEADEYVYTSPEGEVSGKAEDVSALKDGSLTYSTFEIGDLQAMVFGDAGIVIGRSESKGKYKGRDFGGTHRFTDTYVKRDGRWQIVASQETYIAKP
jgi:ketosteroid isomerase-like protein